MRTVSVSEVRADEYKRASLAVWQAVAGSWDERHAYMERVARPVTELLIERLAPKPGDRILELAAGTGVVGLAVAIELQGRGKVVAERFLRADGGRRAFSR